MYTPGPWRIAGNRLRNCFFVADRKHNSVACTSGQSNASSDARLIAAAPEMLQLLQRITMQEEFTTMAPVVQDHVRDVIKKAMGG